MLDLILDLDQEHSFIEKEIAFMRKFAASVESKERLLNFLEFTRKHHEKEETQLFPWLAQQNWLCHGGPRCIFYMGIRLETNPLGHSKMVLNKVKEVYPQFIEPPDEIPQWLVPSSPLSIPMEEHFMGNKFKAALTFLLDHDFEKNFSRDGIGKKVLSAYLDLVELHLNKEKECLFVMCKSHLKN